LLDTVILNGLVYPTWYFLPELILENEDDFGRFADIQRQMPRWRGRRKRKRKRRKKRRTKWRQKRRKWGSWSPPSPQRMVVA